MKLLEVNKEPVNRQHKFRTNLMKQTDTKKVKKKKIE